MGRLCCVVGIRRPSQTHLFQMVKRIPLRIACCSVRKIKELWSVLDTLLETRDDAIPCLGNDHAPDYLITQLATSGNTNQLTIDDR